MDTLPFLRGKIPEIFREYLLYANSPKSSGDGSLIEAATNVPAEDGRPGEYYLERDVTFTVEEVWKGPTRKNLLFAPVSVAATVVSDTFQAESSLLLPTNTRDGCIRTFATPLVWI